MLLAFSGGIDSHALLHLFSHIGNNSSKAKLTAIHINHNLSPKAKQWDKHCSAICKKLGVTYVSKVVPRNIKSSGHSLEEILRKKRYEIFARILPKEACLVTAHHADDQAETLLLQLFRGAGPKGLAAMPRKAKFAKGYLARPLLDCTRKDILFYAHKYNLQWIDDESNADLKFDRNLIRHQLLPLTKKRWPAIITTLNRVARHCFEASELLELLAEKDWQEIVNKSDRNTLDLTGLKKLSISRQKNLLRFWLQKLCLPTPSEVKLLEVIRTVINSRYDAVPVVRWLGAEVRRFRNCLYAMPPIESTTKELIKLKTKIAGKLKLDPRKIRIAFRQGGERVKLLGQKNSRELKKLFQEWDVPPWLRERIPLVYYNEKIIAIVGYTVSI